MKKIILKNLNLLVFLAVSVAGFGLIWFSRSFPYVPFSVLSPHCQLLTGGAMLILLSPAFLLFVEKRMI